MLKLVQSAFYKERETRNALADFVKNANRQLSFGPECREFEKEFALWQGTKFAVMFSSGSTANFSLVQAMMHAGYLKKGDLVGFSAVTWPTNVVPLFQFGLIPVPMDVELTTLNISPRTLENTLKKHKLKAVFLTHVLGLCDDLEAIVRLCNKNGIHIMEDTCEALGTVYHARKLGSFGLAGTFSFFIGHHMSTIEGGMVVTNDRDIARELKIIRSHGWDRHLDPEDQKRLRKEHNIDDFYAMYTFYNLSNNFRPTEISGFLGINQLKYADIIVKKRERNFRELAEIIYPRADLYYPLSFDHIDVISNFAFPLVMREKKIQIEVIERAKDRVEIRPLIGGNIVRQPFYKNHGKVFPRLPNANLIHDQGIYFGNNPDLKRGDIKTITDVFTNFTA